MTSKKVLAKAVSTASPLANKTRKVVVLPGEPSKDFIVNAPCRILNATGVGVTMTAADLPGDSSGTYAWKTTSTKIRLLNAANRIVTVKATGVPSSARDAEVITVTRTALDGSILVKNVLVTVAKLTFSASHNQRYGYDDFDTPNDGADDHVCIKSNDYTFVKVTIEGGAIGTDFEFSCLPARVCTPEAPIGSATFELRLNAARHKKKKTVLSAKVLCPSGDVFSKLNVHIYTEKVVKVLVAKVFDLTSPPTHLVFPHADYAGHEPLANDKLKEAGVKYQISNFDAPGNPTHVGFDTNYNGFLTFDINAGGGAEVQEINSVVTAQDRNQYRVIVVRKMKSFYYLENSARVGDTSITVVGNNIFESEMLLGNGATKELVNVIRNVGNVGYLQNPLRFDHTVGETLEFPAGAWSGDLNNPVVIQEGNETLDVAKWTILHEVGHSALKLSDIVDDTDIMHFQQSWTNYRLRYCPRILKYEINATENQWETIPRPNP